jgi:hypothetical protein
MLFNAEGMYDTVHVTFPAFSSLVLCNLGEQNKQILLFTNYGSGKEIDSDGNRQSGSEV